MAAFAPIFNVGQIFLWKKNKELQLPIRSNATVIPVLQCENWRREAAANEGERDGWIFC